MSDKEKFGIYCSKLVENEVNNWWKIGWSIYPKNIHDVLKMIDNLAKNAHDSWLKEVESGNVPPEDVSPGEGFALCAKIIRECLENK